MKKLLCFLGLFALPPASAKVTELEIIEASLSQSCFNWQVSGGCVWMTVTAFPPSVQIKPSLKVKHSIPDLVISAYREQGENPWHSMKWIDTFANSLVSALFGEFFDGGDTIDKAGNQNAASHIKYKFGAAIGNPLASTYGEVFMDYFMCKSEATSFYPYYNSVADNYLWRTGLAEVVTEVLNIGIPGKSIIGERVEGEEYLFSSKWSGIYPRTGFVANQDDYKAGAVVAARVASITTSGDVTHVGKHLGGGRRDGYWPPGEVKEWDSATGKYQMLYPKKESTCHLFGHKRTNPMNPIGDNYEDRRNTVFGSYSWNFWREYECCKKEGQKLIAHF